MPGETATRLRTSADPPTGVSRGTAAALLASEEDAPIAGLLQAEGIEVSRFSTPQDMLEHPEPDFSLLVYCAQDEPAPVQSIESLREYLGSAPALLVCDVMPRWKLRKLLVVGVSGIVFRAEAESTIGPCLGAILSGQTCVPSRYRDQIEPPVLSTREKQVLSLVVLGYMNSQIAQQLFLAESTVKSHLSSAFGKLGVRSRNEAVELILAPDGGLGMGILALGGEPLQEAHAD